MKVILNPEAEAACAKQDRMVFLDLYKTADYLRDKVVGDNDVSEALMNMFPDHAVHGNDSYWRLYRDWIETEAGLNTWDTLCEILGIDQKLYGQYLQIVFWVSW